MSVVIGVFVTALWVLMFYIAYRIIKAGVRDGNEETRQLLLEIRNLLKQHNTTSNDK